MFRKIFKTIMLAQAASAARKTLRYLSDHDLLRLRTAVAQETQRRGLSEPRQKAQVSRSNKPDPILSELTRSQISLIRSSIQAGVKPGTLSRQFGLTRAQITAALKAGQ